ncbi:MAG: hypothetical protein HYZ28_28490 [Myxococcales bacterium]|nr:hypothetical protein [Myxococcales bacterium]
MVASACWVLALLTAGPPPARAKVVVLQPRSFDASTDKRGEELAELVLTELAATGRVEALGASDISAILGAERQRALLGCDESSSSCLAEIGGALGAPYLVMGSVGRAGARLRVDLKLLQVDGAKVLARQGRVLDSEGDWYAAVARMTRALAAALPEAGARSAAPEGPLAAPSAVPPMVLGGAGAAAAIAGGLAVALSRGEAQAALDSRFSPGVTVQQVSSRYDAAARSHGVGVGLLIGGAAGLGAGALWYLLTPHRPSASAVVSPSPGGVAVSFLGDF